MQTISVNRDSNRTLFLFKSYKLITSLILVLIFFCLPFPLSAELMRFEDLSTLKPKEEGYAEIDGGKLYYQSFGRGPLIIVLHGGPGLDQTYLLPQMLEFSKNYQLVFYDQRGSGKSLSLDALSGTGINMNQFVKDLDALREHLGHKKFILMGHSFGGLLGIHYAILHQARVSSLILINPSPVTTQGLEAFLKSYNQKLLPIQSEINSIATSKPFLEGDPQSVENFYRKLLSIYFNNPNLVHNLSLHFSIKSSLSSFNIYKIFLKNYFLIPHDLRPNLKKIKCPTLVLACSSDVTPLWTTQEISANIPKSKITILKNSGHFPYIEQPESFFNEIHQFLKTDPNPS